MSMKIEFRVSWVQVKLRLSLVIVHFFPPKWSKMIWNAQFWLFCTFPIFSHQSGPKWFGMLNLTHFALFPIFSHQSGPKWFGMLNFAHLHCFQSFPTKVIQNNLECSILHICTFSNLFPPKWSKMIWNVQFCSFCTFSNLFPPKWSKTIWNA